MYICIYVYPGLHKTVKKTDFVTKTVLWLNHAGPRWTTVEHVIPSTMMRTVSFLIRGILKAVISPPHTCRDVEPKMLWMDLRE